jgi:hypothetical protein
VLQDKARAIPPVQAFPGQSSLLQQKLKSKDGIKRRRNLPVIKDLRAEHVSPDAPDEIIPLVTQPLVAERLDVKVVHLEAGVVDVVFRPCFVKSQPSHQFARPGISRK